MKFWDEKSEAMPLEEMEAVQLRGLRKTLGWVYERVPYYRNKLEDVGAKPEDLDRLEDMARFPFTTKADLRDN